MSKVYYCSLKTEEPYRAMANNNRHQPQPLAASQPRPQQAQPPRASSSGLHLPITSLASLHAKPSNNADNGSLSSSNTKTKPTSHAIGGTLNLGGGGTGHHHHMHNNNVKPKKAAGFSLPLNNLPSVLPKAHIVTQGGTQAIEAMGFKSHHPTGAPSGMMGHPAGADPGPGVQHVGNAQSKRCRFALKDNSNTNQTSTSSNASTVIEQIPHSNSSHREPPNSHRRSRSPKRTVTVGMMGPAGPGSQSQTASSSAAAAVNHGGPSSHVTLQENQGGVEFRAPLMIEQASRHVNPVPFETAKLSLFDCSMLQPVRAKLFFHKLSKDVSNFLMEG